MTREELIQAVKAQWCDNGVCRSCGWHALPYEHDVDSLDLSDIQTDELGNQYVDFGCVGEWDDGTHRGVRIYVRPTPAASNE